MRSVFLISCLSSCGCFFYFTQAHNIHFELIEAQLLIPTACEISYFLKTQKCYCRLLAYFTFRTLARIVERGLKRQTSLRDLARHFPLCKSVALIPGVGYVTPQPHADMVELLFWPPRTPIRPVVWRIFNEKFSFSWNMFTPSDRWKDFGFWPISRS